MAGSIAIAAYRTRVLALLDDVSATRYTTAQVDQAIRNALKEYSRALPLQQSYILQADGTQKMMLPADFDAFQVWALQDQAQYPPIDYTFYAYVFAEQWVIETPKRKITAGTALTVLYGGMHIIDGLDSGAGTTIPDDDAEIFSIGAAGFALQSRANSQSESIIASPSAMDTINRQASRHLEQFRAFLRRPAISQVSTIWDLDTNKGY